MKKFIWRIRCTYYFMKIAKTGISLAWYLSGALIESYDWEDYHPHDAAWEEISYWDYDGA